MSKSPRIQFVNPYYTNSQAIIHDRISELRLASSWDYDVHTSNHMDNATFKIKCSACCAFATKIARSLKIAGAVSYRWLDEEEEANHGFG